MFQKYGVPPYFAFAFVSMIADEMLHRKFQKSAKSSLPIGHLLDINYLRAADSLLSPITFSRSSIRSFPSMNLFPGKFLPLPSKPLTTTAPSHRGYLAQPKPTRMMAFPWFDDIFSCHFSHSHRVFPRYSNLVNGVNVTCRSEWNDL